MDIVSQTTDYIVFQVQNSVRVTNISSVRFVAMFVTLGSLGHPLSRVKSIVARLARVTSLKMLL